MIKTMLVTLLFFPIVSFATSFDCPNFSPGDGTLTCGSHEELLLKDVFDKVQMERVKVRETNNDHIDDPEILFSERKCTTSIGGVSIRWNIFAC